jgi:TPR repeat protein
VSRDYGEAIKWYRRAADQGYHQAQHNLGVMYYNGYGLSPDYAEAAKWFRKAALQGNELAQYNLGLMYANGRGLPQDYVQAQLWLMLSAARGLSIAAQARDLVASKMTPAHFSRSRGKDQGNTKQFLYYGI